MSDQDHGYRLREALKKDQSILGFIHDSTHYEMWHWDFNNGNNQWISEKLWGDLGYQAGETRPSWEQVIHQEDLQQALHGIEEVLQNSEKPYVQDMRHIHKNGSTVWIQYRGVFIQTAAGQSSQIIGVRHNITKLVQAKQEAESNQNLLKAIAENFPNSYLSVIERDFSIGFTSGQEFIKQGLDPEVFIGLKVESIFGEHASYVMEEYQKTFDGQSRNFELFINQQYQRYRTVPLYDDQGRIPRILAVAENITEQKERELELQKAKDKAEEGDRLKSAFLANMSHEIRTPLNAILGFSNLLQDDDLSNEEKAEYLSYINSGGNRLLNIISDIIDISKLDANQLALSFQPVNLNRIMDHLQAQFEIDQSNNNCQLAVEKGLSNLKSSILTDETRLTQILSNLIENALKFTENGKIVFGYSQTGEMLEFFVRDNGIGIHPDDQKAIFNRFIQAQNQHKNDAQHSGTGLGLSIVQSLVTLFGGKVWLQSEPGQGSTFYFNIPYHPNHIKKASGQIQKDGSNQKSSLKILVAEDEPINYFYIKAALKGSHTLIHAQNGREAVDVMQNDPDIDIILMDIRMPELNGYEALSEIRAFNPTVPAIAITAYAMASDKEKTQRAGFNAYLPKPLNRKDLVEVIQKHVKQ